MSEIIHGDSIEVLNTLADESVDLVCTDPPYGYSFMGKSWDKTLPDIGIFKECLRVLKPGSFAFVMSAPRSDVCARMMLLLEDAGFEIGFTPIYWTYASGFPKAMNIGKMVDKRLGVEREVTGYESKHINRPQTDNWDKSAQPISKGIFTEAKGGGLQPITAPATPEAKALNGSYGGFQPKPAVEVVIVAMKPLSEKTYVDQALKETDCTLCGGKGSYPAGYNSVPTPVMCEQECGKCRGTGKKPGMKGVTWLDDCRIPLGADFEDRPQRQKSDAAGFGSTGFKSDREQPMFNSAGRFPANLLVSDDVLNDGRITKSTGGTGEASRNWKSDGHTISGSAQATGGFGDSGSYSRYFDLDAWEDNRLTNQHDKDTSQHTDCVTGDDSRATLDSRPELKTLPFLIVPKASKSEKNAGLDGFAEKQAGGMSGTHDKSLKTGSGNERNNMARNFHPTVKPLKLMSYLITLGSRAGDVVLDPFLGSGTTAIAAKQLGREYIGIEREKEYVEIAEARIKSIPDSLL